jgi:hypothetical protein
MNKAELTADGLLLWHCPGCDRSHGVPVVGGRAWGWNKSLSSPTLTPSVHVHGHPTSPPFKPQPNCHCLMTDGRLQFLDDCGHALAGQTVEMEAWK